MSFRILGLALLIWFPGVLHAQTSTPCSAPRLDGGYFVPEQVSYQHGTQLTYSCDSRRKPVVEGWWAKSTCENGKWSHNPECIDEKSCFPPDIPHAKYADVKGWYHERHKMQIACDEGYAHKSQDATAECLNGTWICDVVCEKRDDSCGEPPQINHAVIIRQRYQDVFAVYSTVQYECEDGYVVEGAITKQSLRCRAGNWARGQPCRRGRTADSARDGGQPTVEERGNTGSPTTSARSESQPTGGGRESRPSSRHEGQPATAGGTGITGAGHVTTGVSTSSGPNDRQTEPLITRISRCGQKPQIQNGDIVEAGVMYLKYQCANFYKRVGPDTVVCHNDGTWSQLPTCKEAFCAVAPETPLRWDIRPLTSVKYVKEDQPENFDCTWAYYYSVVRCTDGKLSFSNCCTQYDIHHNRC